MPKKHSHYYRSVEHLKEVDIYRLLDLFGVTCPCAQHAIKKLMAAGVRGAKNEQQDLSEAMDTIKRKLEMIQEDMESAKYKALEIEAAKQMNEV